MLDTTPSVRVLLVDDDADFLVIWRLLLAQDDRFGPVDEAESGEDALSRLRSSVRPDAVVSDVRMGAVSGFDVLDVVRRTYPGTPVVLTSGTDGLSAEALGRGATAFFAKADTTSETFAERLWTALSNDARFRHPQDIRDLPHPRLDAPVDRG